MEMWASLHVYPSLFRCMFPNACLSKMFGFSLPAKNTTLALLSNDINKPTNWQVRKFRRNPVGDWKKPASWICIQFVKWHCITTDADDARNFDNLRVRFYCNNLGWFALKCGLPRQKQLEGVHFVLELPASEDVCLVDFSLIYLMFCGAAY